MNFLILILALASLAAAAADWRASVTYCLNSSSDTTPGCSALTLSADGCYNLDDADGFRGTTHYISTSDNVRCDVFRNGDCKGSNLGQVTAAGKHFDAAASSVRCNGHGPV